MSHIRGMTSFMTTSGKTIPDISDSVYTDKLKPPKYNATLPLTALHGGDGAKYLRQRLQGWTKEDHEEAAVFHLDVAEATNSAWSEVLRRAHQAVFHVDLEFTDYKISGIGRDEYTEAFKDAARSLAHGATQHASIARLHWMAAGHRSPMA